MAQVRLLFYVIAVLAVITILCIHLPTELEIKDALYLTKNSITELRTCYFRKDQKGSFSQNETIPIGQKESILNSKESSSSSGLESILDLPATNMMRSILPVDLIISYTISNHTNEIIGRYASFSPILEEKLSANYKIISSFACSPVQADDEYKDKILIVLRGNCTFVNKVENLLSTNIQPRAIIIADNKPYHSLITMYSPTFNRDGLLTVPVLFISNEDYVMLNGYSQENIELSIETMTIDNWLSLLMLIAVSPTILIILFYLCIRGFQLCHKKIVNSANERLVKKLPVYIFNEDHLIPVSKFMDYLAITGQTSDAPLPLSSSESLPAGQETERQHPRGNIVINGVRIRDFPNLHLLFAPKDFYLTSKCAICLDKFTPLRLRILVLKCKHFYHEDCLSNWLINFKRTCPLCNESFSVGEALPLLANAAYLGGSDVDLENQLLHTLDTARSRRLECDSFHSCLREPSVSIRTARDAENTRSDSDATSANTAQPVQSPQTSFTVPNAATQFQQTNNSDTTYSNVGSIDSFVTTRTHNTDGDSVVSNYVTPQQTPHSTTGDSLLDSSSKLTIKISSP